MKNLILNEDQVFHNHLQILNAITQILYKPQKIHEHCAQRKTKFFIQAHNIFFKFLI